MPNELILDRKEVECLKVVIEGKNYEIPLATSLKRSELTKLKTEEGVMKFFEEYLGKELFDDLSIGEIKQIVTAWSKATEEASGVSLGNL